MTYRVGRTIVTPYVQIPNVSASGYDAGDAIGRTFSAENALGEPGGLLAGSLLQDRGSGTGHIRLHFFDSLPSAQANGGAWVLATADEVRYLGSVDHSATTWKSGTRFFSQVLDQNLPLWASGSTRWLYCQAQAVVNLTAYVETGLSVRWGVLQD